jgi:hypothetical protein
MGHSSPDQTVRTSMKEIPASVAVAVDPPDRILNLAGVKVDWPAPGDRNRAAAAIIMADVQRYGGP